MEKKVFSFFKPVPVPETMQSYLHPSEQLQFAIKTLVM